MKAFLRPHRFRHLYPVRFYTTKVISGHCAVSDQCPLYPRKQTLVERVEMSALFQKQTCQLLRLYVDLLLNNNREREGKRRALARL